LTAKGPFLDLLRAFKEELDKADRLTVVGYSLRDEHINEFLGQWLNGDTKRVMRIINGPRFRQTEVLFARRLLALPPGRLEVIEANASEGIQRCFGEVPPTNVS
jgi:hypothetical protein